MNQKTTGSQAIEKQLQEQVGELQLVAAQSRAERDLFESVLDSVDTLVVILDHNGRIVRFNQTCEELTGYAAAEVEGQRFWNQLLDSENQASVQAALTDLVVDALPRQSEGFWRTKDGRRLIAWSHTPVFDDNDNVAYIISTGKDITKRAQTAMLLDAGESLRRVTTALLQHLTTLNDVLEIVCTEALELTGATGSAVLLLEDETWLRVTTNHGFPTPILERVPVGKSFAGSVIGQGHPLLLNDPEHQIQAYHRNPDLKTLLAVPLYVDDAVLGVLDVVNKPGGFTDEDIQVMQLFADQSAIAIEHAQLHQQAERLAVIEERQRLARELHDSVTQALYSVTLYADATGMALSAGKLTVVAEHLHELRNMAREAMLDMRLLIFELHPPVLEKEGLAAVVQTRLETVEARSGLQTKLDVAGKETRLPLAIEEELYRIVQEALNNAVKHARAKRVTIALKYEPHCFCLEVRDDGRGFDVIAARQSGGMGLRGIAERVQRISGKLAIDSTPAHGTILKVEVKL